MAATGQKKLLALDTNFLFDLAAEEDFAEDFKEFFRHLEETSLSMAFSDADLAPVTPAHPMRLLRSAQQMF